MKRILMKADITGIYALYYKNEIVYVGESVDINTRAPHHRYDKPKIHFDSWKIISTVEEFPFLNDVTFRLYYENCCIKWLKPKYQEWVWKDNKRIPLNLWLMKRYLWNQNPNPDILPLLSHKKKPMEFFWEKMNGYYVEFPTGGMRKRKNGRIRENEYTRVWETLDLSKKLYIGGESAFEKLVDHNVTKDKLKGNSSQLTFKKPEENLHN